MITRTIKPKRFSPDMPVIKSTEPKPIYPKITISFKDLPEAKKWKVGETYEVELEIKQIGSRIDEYAEEATFEIRKIAVDNDDESKENE